MKFQPIPASRALVQIGNDLHDFEDINLGGKRAELRMVHEDAAHTAPLVAKSSPRLIVVPTAMKSFVPVSVLIVSNITQSTQLTNSFCANSYLLMVSFYKLRESPWLTHPLTPMCLVISTPELRTHRMGTTHWELRSLVSESRFRLGKTHHPVPKSNYYPRRRRRI